MTLNFIVKSEFDGYRTSDFLRSCGLTAGFIRSVKYLPQGICVSGEQIKTNTILREGMQVDVIMPPEPVSAVVAEDIPLEILYEDEFCMVINKPANLLVHPSTTQSDNTLAGGWCSLMEKRGTPSPFRAVTRLDKNTSGVVLVAKNRYAAPIIFEGAVKIYYAVCEGEILGEGIIDAPIAVAEGSIITRCVSAEGKPSKTAYKSISVGGGHTLLRLQLFTGRTHQIRVHLAHIGHPIAGDDMYGGSTEHIERQALHSKTIVFITPVENKSTRVSAEFPEDIIQLCRKLNLNNKV